MLSRDGQQLAKNSKKFTKFYKIYEIRLNSGELHKINTLSETKIKQLTFYSKIIATK